MLNVKSSENFAPTKIGHILAVLGGGGLGDRGYKVLIFTAKGTPVNESTSFEPFCMKIRWGV